MHWYVNYPESDIFFTPMHNINFSYPAHLHGCLEVSFCTTGTVTVRVDGERCVLESGTGILIPPNTVHSYHSGDTSEYYTILFSRNLLPELAGIFVNRRPQKYCFSMDKPLNQQLLEFYDSGRTIWGAKSLLYRTAEAFLQNNIFQAAALPDTDLVKQIVTYIQDNLCREITLQDLAHHLGYSYCYISKRIRQVFGVPFTVLLAQYRVAKVKMLLSSGNYTITQAALSSGFGSVRTFNRIFLNITGMTPSQYLAAPVHMEILPPVKS